MQILRRWFFYALLALLFACGSSNSENSPCGDCTPSKPDTDDFRHAEKHVPIPPGTPTEITVATILSWPQQPVPADDTPRTGRELQLFHISQAYIQAVWMQPTDCDIHMEIADTPSKTAPRAIIETPRDQEYCAVRKQETALFAAHGVSLMTQQQEVPSPFPVSVLGLAFEDFGHARGSALVQTLWELHPAVVQGQ
jgi:hypothetical protein